MAIYHFAVQHFSRGKGHSAIAASAYRSGQALESEHAGRTFDYSRKQDVTHENTLLPEGAPERLRDRQTLWNEVGTEVETRKNSRLAIGFEAAIPRELSKEQGVELVESWVQKELVRRGAAVDYAMHSGQASDGKDNPHVHIMATTRAVRADGWGEKIRDWQKFDQKQQLQHWRESWAEHVNESLERARSPVRVDHRSLKAQGIDREPQIHMGKHAWNAEQKGIQTERGNQWRGINSRNHEQQLQANWQAKIDRRRQERVKSMYERFGIRPPPGREKQRDRGRDFGMEM